MHHADSTAPAAADARSTRSEPPGCDPAWDRHNGARQVVIALHCSGSSGGQWSALRGALTPALDLLTPDLRGHGGNTAGTGSADIVADDVAHVAALAESVPGGAHLVGHSYGGAIALRVAIRHPEAVRSVTAYEPVPFRLVRDFDPRSPEVAELEGVARKLRAWLRAGSPMAAAEHFVDYWSGQGAWQRCAADRRAAIAARMETVAQHFTALMEDSCRLQDYRTLGMPALLLFGQERRAPMRRIEELLRQAIPAATTETQTGMGHMGPVTHPAAIARRIRAFVQARVRADEIGAAAAVRLAA